MLTLDNQIRPSDVLLQTMDKIKAGEEPTVDNLKESLSDAMFSIACFAKIINDLKKSMHLIAVAHVQNDPVGLQTRLDSLVDDCGLASAAHRVLH